MYFVVILAYARDSFAVAHTLSYCGSWTASSVVSVSVVFLGRETWSGVFFFVVFACSWFINVVLLLCNLEILSFRGGHRNGFFMHLANIRHTWTFCAAGRASRTGDPEHPNQ